MSLMELIVKTFKAKKSDLIILFINTFVVILFYYLLFENSEILYPLALSLFVIFIYFVIEIIKHKNFNDKLIDSKNSPNYKNNNVTFLEEEVLNTISDIHKDYQNKLHTLNNQISERDTLFSQWIHNMKTSITVIDLACEKRLLEVSDDKYIEDIKEENNTLRKNLEECLNVLRLDDFSRDYVTDPYNLRDIVNEVVNLKKRDFIYKRVFPKVNIEENLLIYTDKKWFSYMLEQVIANSIKYSKEKSGAIVEIEAKRKEDKIELFIKDSGIGIKEEDLPRVFEPFFTGDNGRKERSATGIGLYMVKLISKKLSHSVEINSQLNKGTIIKITI